MFGKKAEFIYRMKGYMNDALRGSCTGVPCAEEIRPMIKAFFKKSMNAKVQWDGSEVCYHIEGITQIVRVLAMNTRNYEKLSSKEIASLKKIFDELDVLHTEALQHNSQSKSKYDLSLKIDCISGIIWRNMADMHDSREKHENYRDGMIFQNYEDLWKVIHRVNTEWNELCNRGFSLRVFDDYWEALRYERGIGQQKREEEKLATLMEILDGKKKFVPIYEHKAICFKVVDNDFEGEIVNTLENEYSRPYRMYQDGEEVLPVDTGE